MSNGSPKVPMGSVIGLGTMPMLPFYQAAWSYLCKPFVRGLESHLLALRAFKYVWIDTNWRPQ
jgi:hypothetical protein